MNILLNYPLLHDILSNFKILTLGFEIIVITAIILLTGKIAEEGLDLFAKGSTIIATGILFHDKFGKRDGGINDNNNKEDKDKKKLPII